MKNKTSTMKTDEINRNRDDQGNDKQADQDRDGSHRSQQGSTQQPAGQNRGTNPANRQTVPPGR